MGEHVRIRLEFVVKSAGSLDGLEKVTDFIGAGLQEVLHEKAFPVDIEPGAKMALFNLERRRPPAKKKATKKRG